MGLIDTVKRRLARVTGDAAEDLGRLERAARFQVRLWRFCAWRLRETNAMAMSAALSFRTIFALVPMLVLAFLVLKSVGVVDDSKKMLHTFMEESGLTQIEYTREPPPEPAPGEPAPAPRTDRPVTLRPDGSVAPPRTRTVADTIERAMARAEDQLTIGRLGPIGAALLIWTALTLLMTMERSLNRIFEAPRPRSLGRRIMLYWSVITLGPFVLLAATYAGEKAFTAAAGMPTVACILGATGWVVSLVLGMVFLALVYTLMPNTSVPVRAAMAGAAIAFPAWLLARWGFALYVENVGTKSLYGALALLPLFLLWLNLSWTIFLLGAQLVFALSNPRRVATGGRSLRHIISHWDLLAAIVAVARLNRKTGRPVPLHEVAGCLALPEDAAEQVVACLARAGLVLHSADAPGRPLVLARPAETIPVAMVLDLSCEAGRGADPGWSGDIAEAVAEVRKRTGAGLGDLTVAALVKA
jgi:membrane protein